MNITNDRLKYDLYEYKLEIKITETKRLLVEGRDDLRFFSRLISEFKAHDRHVLIDTAQDLEGGFSEVRGNREKIEFVCSILDEECWEKFVAFVDREFRGFERDNVIQDIFPEHKVNKGLVWSRGHSVENYFFDVAVLRESFKDLIPISWFDKVIDIFDRIIVEALKLACALSLTGNEIQQFKVIKRTIHWKFIEVSSLHVKLSQDKWRDELINRGQQDFATSVSILEKYISWREKLENVDLKTLQWLCHGHIGMTVLWAVYTQCLRIAFPTDETQELKTLIGKMEGIGEEIRFQSFTGSLTRKALQNKCEYPKEVIELLGLSTL